MATIPAPRPSQRRRDALLAYMVEIRDLLRLNAWDIGIAEEPPTDDDAVLSITPNPSRWWARIRVGSFFDPPGPDNPVAGPLEQRHVVAHELLHLPAAALTDYIELGPWRERLDAATARDIEKRVISEIENLVDFAARAMAPSLPLPPEWPE